MRYRAWTKKEDAILKKYAGVKTALEIGIILNRPKNGVHHRINKLNLNGRLCGEHHWNCKIDNLTSEMIFTLHDAGYKPKEIEQVLNNAKLSRLQITTLLTSGRQND